MDETYFFDVSLFNKKLNTTKCAQNASLYHFEKHPMKKINDIRISVSLIRWLHIWRKKLITAKQYNECLRQPIYHLIFATCILYTSVWYLRILYFSIINLCSLKKNHEFIISWLLVITEMSHSSMQFFLRRKGRNVGVWNLWSLNTSNSLLSKYVNADERKCWEHIWLYFQCC